MTVRLLCAVLLLRFGSSAHAVDVYEFESYCVSSQEGSDPAVRLSHSHVGERFEGWIVHDADRNFPTDYGEWRYLARLAHLADGSAGVFVAGLKRGYGMIAAAHAGMNSRASERTRTHRYVLSLLTLLPLFTVTSAALPQQQNTCRLTS